MSNSALIDYIKLSPNSTNPRRDIIRKITIHHMAGNITVEQCGNGFADPNRQGSSNYGIGTNGKRAMYVEEINRAWTSSNPANDHQAITIEVANDGGENWHVSDAALESLIELCVDICQRNGIKALNYTGDATGNLTRHNMFAATACPATYLQSKFPYIADEVNKRLGVSTTTIAKVVQAAAVVAAQPKNYNTTLPTRIVLSKGSKGVNVGILQTALNKINGAGLKIDEDFGNVTFTAVINFQNKYKLLADGVVGSNTIGKINAILNGNIITAVVAKVTTVYSDPYVVFVKEVQAAIGAVVDGIAGKETLSKTITVSMYINSYHAVVKAIQRYLNSMGYTDDSGNYLVEDGKFGLKSKQSVVKFQKAHGGAGDGEITAQGNTWKWLLKLA